MSRFFQDCLFGEARPAGKQIHLRMRTRVVRLPGFDLEPKEI